MVSAILNTLQMLCKPTVHNCATNSLQASGHLGNLRRRQVTLGMQYPPGQLMHGARPGCVMTGVSSLVLRHLNSNTTLTVLLYQVRFTRCKYKYTNILRCRWGERPLNVSVGDACTHIYTLLVYYLCR
jgi:hypothetical protein